MWVKLLNNIVESKTNKKEDNNNPNPNELALEKQLNKILFSSNRSPIIYVFIH
jgi:hypothetical protein